MRLDIEDFIRRLDSGEFDGNLDEVLAQLDRDQLQLISDRLDERARKQRAESGWPPHDPERDL